MVQEHDSRLGEFFSRPVKIASYDWGTQNTFYQTLNPHAAFWNDPRVNNRMNNYELLQYKLKVKITINGGSFYSGRLMVSYLPLHQIDATTQDRALIPQDHVQMSQLPHIFIDPMTSDGAEMEIPFYWFYDYVSVSRFEQESLGRLSFRQLQPLRHANIGVAAPPVTLTVFAWAEDVQLLMPTSVDNTQLIPQSGLVNQDEMDTEGLVSKPATAVANFSNNVGKLFPIIAPYATALELAAGATARIAKLFGYSRPLKDEGNCPYRPEVMGNMSNYNVPDSSTTLALDVKQGVTIDPRVTGLTGEDSLSLLSIASRESYLTSFNWNRLNGQNSLLFNMRIDPGMFRTDSTGTQPALHLTPMAVASVPFKYWTGSIKIRFQICNAAMHKGRLRLVYDPRNLGPTVGDEFNINHSHVLDISEQNDFTVQIGRGQRESLMLHARPGLESETQLFSTSRYTNPESFGNGVLGVYVVNELTVPNGDLPIDDQTVGINVFVSAGEDFELFEPINALNDYAFGLENQSNLENQSIAVDQVAETAKPIDNTPIILGAQPADSSELGIVYTGERILSARQLMKRYNLTRLTSNVVTDQASVGFLTVTVPFWPLYRGYVPDANDYLPAGATAAFDCVGVTQLNWWASCFNSVRGARRYKMIPSGWFNDGAEGNVEHRAVERLTGRVPYREERIDPGNSGSLLASEEYLDTINRTEGLLPVGHTGCHYSIADQNQGIEFEIPYYDNRRFVPIRTFNMRQASYNNVTQPFEGTGFRYSAFHKPTLTSSGTARWTATQMYVAAGEDMTMNFWVGMPPIIYQPVNPAR